MPSSFSVGTLGISGSRFSLAMARNLQLAGVHLALLRQVGVGEIDVAAEDRVHARRQAVIGHVLELDAGRLLDRCAGKMWLVEPSVAPTVISPGPLLGVGDELLPVLPRRLGAGGQHRRRRRHQADRLEVLVFDVGDAGVVASVDVVVHGVERVAVRGRALGLARADGARCAADVGDHHRSGRGASAAAARTGGRCCRCRRPPPTARSS